MANTNPDPARVQKCLNEINARYNNCKQMAYEFKVADINAAMATYAKYQGEAEDRRKTKLAECDNSYQNCVKGSSGIGSGSGNASVGLGGFLSEKEQQCKKTLDECRAEAEESYARSSENNRESFLTKLQEAEDRYQNAVEGCFNNYDESRASCLQNGFPGGVLDGIGELLRLSGEILTIPVQPNVGGILPGGFGQQDVGRGGGAKM